MCIVFARKKGQSAYVCLLVAFSSPPILDPRSPIPIAFFLL